MSGELGYIRIHLKQTAHRAVLLTYAAGVWIAPVVVSTSATVSPTAAFHTLTLAIELHTHTHTNKRRQSTEALALLSRPRGVVVSGVRRTNEVNPRRARLVPGWVTVYGRVYHLGM